MRVVLDTNVFISGLGFPDSAPGRLLEGWYDGRFSLLACEDLIAEVRRVSRYPKMIGRYAPSLLGALVNDLRSETIFIDRLPPVDLSPDPWDNYLLALAEAGQADFLVTGDKRDLLALGHHGRTVITTVRAFLDRL